MTTTAASSAIAPAGNGILSASIGLAIAHAVRQKLSSIRHRRLPAPEPVPFAWL